MQRPSVNHQPLIVVLVASMSFLLIGGCTKKAETPDFVFAELPITYSAVTHIAKMEGYYQDAGLQYVSVSVPAGPDVMSALRARGSNAATGGAIAVTPVISMIGAGDHPVVLATTLKSDRRVRLITFADSGISDDPSTLKGKTIGIVRNTVGDIYLSRLLKKGGLTNDDVKLVHGRPADLKNLLLRGDLDAATLWDPFIQQITRDYADQTAAPASVDRGEVQIFVDPQLYVLAFNVVTTRKVLEDRRGDLVAMLMATIKGGEYMESNSEAAQGELERWLALDAGVLDEFMETTEFDVHLDVEAMKRWMAEELEWLKELKPDTEIPVDLSPYVDSTLLEEIDPGRVIR